MTYLILFWTFFKIGLFTFGGGHAMIPMIMDEVVTKGWLSEAELKQLIAVSESTPGPFAINIATFVGSSTSQLNFLGALSATLGVVLPSFIIILIIAALLTNFTKYKAVRRVMSAIRPVVVGLIIAAGLNILLTNVFTAYPTLTAGFDGAQLVLFAVLLTAKLCFPKQMTPIPLILLSAGLGIIVYGV